MVFSTTKTRKVNINPVVLLSCLYFTNKATAHYRERNSKSPMIGQVHLSSPCLLLSHLHLSPLLFLFFLFLSLIPTLLPFLLTLVCVDSNLGAGLLLHKHPHTPSSTLTFVLANHSWLGSTLDKGAHVPTASWGLVSSNSLGCGQCASCTPQIEPATWLMLNHWDTLARSSLYFLMLSQPCNHRINLVMLYKFLYMFWSQSANILLRMFVFTFLTRIRGIFISVFFACGIFIWFGMKVMFVSQDEFGIIPSFIFWKIL